MKTRSKNFYLKFPKKQDDVSSTYNKFLSRKYVKVYLVENHEEIHSILETLQLPSVNLHKDTRGYFRIPELDFDLTSRMLKDNCLIYLFFMKGQWQLSYVSHEVHHFHGLLHELMNLHINSLGYLDSSEEELVCYICGFLTDDIYGWLWDSKGKQ